MQLSFENFMSTQVPHDDYPGRRLRVDRKRKRERGAASRTLLLAPVCVLSVSFLHPTWGYGPQRPVRATAAYLLALPTSPLSKVDCDRMPVPPCPFPSHPDDPTVIQREASPPTRDPRRTRVRKPQNTQNGDTRQHAHLNQL